jgi:major membrane immunogen (membrane-anchored lipoprotein)
VSRAHCGLAVVLASAVLLAACSEKPQTNAEGVKQDTAPWSGTGTAANTGTAFSAPGWKVGDKVAWEQQLKSRAQNGQNEYNKD